MRDVNFLRHNIYCDACVFFFYGIYFFENHGLGLGPALFRLGTRVGPVMKKNLVWVW
jgi:hypothetical protein